MIEFLDFRSCCIEGPKLIDASGHGIPELLEAILKFFPLDTYVFNPVVLMDLVNSDKNKGDLEVRFSYRIWEFKVDQLNRGSITMFTTKFSCTSIGCMQETVDH